MQWHGWISKILCWVKKAKHIHTKLYSMILFYILFWVVVTWVYKVVKTHLNEYLRPMLFIEYKLHLGKNNLSFMNCCKQALCIFSDFSYLKMTSCPILYLRTASEVKPRIQRQTPSEVNDKLQLNYGRNWVSAGIQLNGAKVELWSLFLPTTDTSSSVAWKVVSANSSRAGSWGLCGENLAGVDPCGLLHSPSLTDPYREHSFPWIPPVFVNHTTQHLFYM